MSCSMRSRSSSTVEVVTTTLGTWGPRTATSSDWVLDEVFREIGSSRFFVFLGNLMTALGSDGLGCSSSSAGSNRNPPAEPLFKSCLRDARRRWVSA